MMSRRTPEVVDHALKPLEPRAKRRDVVLTPDVALKLAVFSGLPRGQLAMPVGGIMLRRYETGDVICRQGDPGHTAFYVLRPQDVAAIRDDLEEGVAADLPPSEDEQKPREIVRVLMAEPVAARTGPGRQRRNRFFGLLARMQGPRSDDASAAAVVPAETVENEVARLCEGELFGEMACLNRAPRSATIKALQPILVVEMLRHILRVVRERGKNEELRDYLKQVYEKRSLYAHLANSPLLQDLDRHRLEALRDRVRLIELKAGEVFMKEGDPPDYFYLISLGQVSVWQKRPGGEERIAYRWRGDTLGEISLLRNQPKGATCMAYGNPLRSTRPNPERVDRTQLLRMDRETFLWLTGDSTPAGLPELPADWTASFREKVIQIAEDRDRGDALRSRVTTDEWTSLSRWDQYHELGLPQGEKLMLIDLDRCTRCDECARACAATHADHRSRLLREGPRFGNFLVPATCRQCRDPVCLLDCPVSSIFKAPGGNITITDWCIGCKRCAELCPYDAINIHERPPDAGGKAQELAVTCDQCTSLSDGIPSCVYACPHDAAMRIDGLEFLSIARGGKREQGTLHAH